jgi:serine/threonine protein kinase
VVKKIPIPEHRKNRDALNEIDVLTKLEHPNIVKYYDSCLHVSPHLTEIHIYMEYMNQGSILQLINRFGAFRNEEVLSNYARQILNGLYYLHS